jgi:hypothetical protein
LIYRQLNVSHFDLWSMGAYLVFLVFLGTRARALKSRVAELVDVAALRAGLQRMTRQGKIAAPTVEPDIAVPVNVTDPPAPNLPG